MEIEYPYNPLDKNNLARSVANALMFKKPIPLQNIPLMHGAGIYAIYYTGTFDLYQSLNELHGIKPFMVPIYVGKAVPTGARKGGLGFDSSKGIALFQRINEHGKSIQSAENLSAKDFYCRYLMVDDIWIPLGESLLIEIFKPVWNRVVDGFGNHDPGSGRYQQKMSPWDILHPGRDWAKRLQEGKALQHIQNAVLEHFANYMPLLRSRLSQNETL